MVSSRKKHPEPEPEPEPLAPEADLDEDEGEPCIAALFMLASKMEHVGDTCLNVQQYQFAIGAYNSAVQTLVTAHQLNEQLAARAAYYEAQQAQQPPESAAQGRNKRDFPYMEGETQG